MIKLTLYSRPDCHLCEALLGDLLPLLPPDVSVETVDVDSSVALERRYGLRIPVLVAGDHELSSYPLDRDRLRVQVQTTGLHFCKIQDVVDQGQKVVAGRFRERKEIVRRLDADSVAGRVVDARAAVAVLVEAGHRIGATGFEFATQHIAFGHRSIIAPTTP